MSQPCRQSRQYSVGRLSEADGFILLSVMWPADLDTHSHSKSVVYWILKEIQGFVSCHNVLVLAFRCKYKEPVWFYVLEQDVLCNCGISPPWCLVHFPPTVNGRQIARLWPASAWAPMGNCCCQRVRQSRCGIWTPRRSIGWVGGGGKCVWQGGVAGLSDACLHPNVALVAEIHRSLHNCDDPMLRHHTAPGQQRPLFSFRGSTWSTAQRLVSATPFCFSCHRALTDFVFSSPPRQVREDGKDKNSVVSFALTDEPQHIDLIASKSREEVRMMER